MLFHQANFPLYYITLPHFENRGGELNLGGAGRVGVGTVTTEVAYSYQEDGLIE